MINAEKIKNFWDNRGKKFASRPSENMANLEEDPTLLALKIRLEQEVVMPRIKLHDDMNVLDLGAGYGQWAFRFAPFVRTVTAVEFSQPMLEAGVAEARRRGITNINFIHSAVEKFTTTNTYSLVFISGLFMYLNDFQASLAVKTASAAVEAGGSLFLRESISLLGHRYIIDDRYSAAANDNYSALYRMPEEFITMFTNQGLNLIEHANMFSDGCPLNKWNETRLHFFLFNKKENKDVR